MYSTKYFALPKQSYITHDIKEQIYLICKTAHACILHHCRYDLNASESYRQPLCQSRITGMFIKIYLPTLTNAISFIHDFMG